MLRFDYGNENRTLWSGRKWCWISATRRESLKLFIIYSSNFYVPIWAARNTFRRRYTRMGVYHKYFPLKSQWDTSFSYYIDNISKNVVCTCIFSVISFDKNQIKVDFFNRYKSFYRKDLSSLRLLGALMYTVDFQQYQCMTKISPHRLL